VGSTDLKPWQDNKNLEKKKLIFQDEDEAMDIEEGEGGIAHSPRPS
jgi:hypothetical protein